MENYPKPAHPTAPVLSWGFTLGGRRDAAPCLLDVGDTRLLTSGRMAIAMALQEMAIGPGDKVLIPSYHCLAMVYPVSWIGADYDFFQINPDLTVDLEDIQRRIDPSVRVLMVTHYFGFPQAMGRLRALCDRHNILLLEDCAHAMFGQVDGRPLGTWGDYAIASPMKFYPSYDGGCLVSARHALISPLTGNGRGFEIKIALNTLERAFGYGRLWPMAALLHIPLWLKDRLWTLIKARHRSSGAPRFQAPLASEGGFGFDTEWIDRRMSLISRWILRLASPGRIARRRRTHYRRLSRALADLPGCRPLVPELPRGTVPYMFPLLVDDPETVFPQLKRRAVPLLRFGEQLWAEMEAGDYPTARCYSRHLLQFPCHQEMRPGELEWMIQQIRTVFLEQAAGASPANPTVGLTSTPAAPVAATKPASPAPGDKPQTAPPPQTTNIANDARP